MKATTAEAAVHFEAAHGSNWWDKFTVIWLAEERVLALLGKTAPGAAAGQEKRSKPARRSTPCSLGRGHGKVTRDDWPAGEPSTITGTGRDHPLIGWRAPLPRGPCGSADAAL